MLADHQARALTHALMLLRTYGGAILADDVGLGKSFVAAAVARCFAKVDLVVPAALVEQWRETLAAFDVDATILTHDALYADPFVPAPDDRLVIVDEAHAFRNPATRRYAALARRSVGAKLLLVTATPVCNSVRDLEALVALIARDDLLAHRGVPSIDVAFEQRDRALIDVIVRELVIRRERDVLPISLQFGTLERRVIRHPVPDVRALVGALRFPLVGEYALLRRFLLRRLESSEAALLESIHRQLRFYERALDSGLSLSKRDYRQAFAHEEDREAFQQVLFWELFVPAESAIDASAVREEMARLEALRKAAQQSPCEKRRMLVELVGATREPMLIFTGAAATARDLQRVLQCGLITSRERSREDVLRAFRTGKIDVVVTTDLAAEGLNLQRAGAVVHYDLPWNPVRLDQRNGRAHRIGQARDVVRAIYFVPEHDETRVVRTLARKERLRNRTLRGTPPVPLDASMMRPRLAAGAAYFAFRDAAMKAGLEVPERLARRHKAGVERLLAEMAKEYLDRERLEALLAVVE